MAVRAQVPGGEEWRGDVCYLGQQQGGSPVSPSAALGPLQSLAGGMASPLCCSRFCFIVLNPISLHPYL